MKKALSLFLSIVMLLSITAGLDLTANAEVLTGNCGDNVTYSLDTSTGVLTISGTGKITDYSWENSAPWYFKRSSIKTVEIKSGVTDIGDYAFERCNKLTSVTMSDSVTSIGEWAFSNCVSLTSITIPDSVTSIGNGTFSECDSLTSITIPDGVTSIGNGTFSGCDSLTSITIPDSITSIGGGAFYGCSSITDIIVCSDNQYYSSLDGVLFNKEKTELIQYPIGNARRSYTIPDSVISIDDCAFEYYSKMISITIPDSVTRINDYAFYGCSNLLSVHYSGTIEQWNNVSIGEYNYDLKNAMIQCSDGIKNKKESTGSCGNNLSYSFDMDTGVLTIFGTGKMYDYNYDDNLPQLKKSAIYEVVIKSGVTSIGKNAFYDCSSLTSVTIPDSVTSIGESAFRHCSSLTSVTMGNGVTSIGSCAFDDCSSLTSITIPNSVKRIGSSVFSDCYRLTGIIVDSNNQYYSSLDGVLFNKDNTELIQYPIGNTRTSYTIPDSVTRIGNSAFEDCTGLTSVTIPDSITSIGEEAFSFCSSLTSVTIPNSVTSIGYGAFECCRSLTSITIPDSVTSIGESAFRHCSSLTNATMGNSVTSIGACAFYCCNSLSSITIPNSVTNIGDMAFYDTAYYKDESNWVDDVLYIDNALIKAKDTLSGDYAIKDGTTVIAYYAFHNLNSLTDMEIPNSVISIGACAFDGCSSLTNVTVGNNVRCIGYASFGCCDALKDVYYSGTEEQWNSIDIGSYNDYLINATIHYHQHIYTDVVTPPSCTEGGYTTHTCTVCSDSYVDSYTNPIGHIFNGCKNCVVCGVFNPNYVEPTTTPTPQPQPTPTQPTTTAPAQTTTTKPAIAVKKPKSTSISKLTKGKKQFKVTWKKVGSISGYQIQYSTDKKFKKNTKTVTAKKGSTSATIKKLKSKKTYYVRVRTYKTVKVNGKTTKVYSSRSKVKSVKTK